MKLSYDKNKSEYNLTFTRDILEDLFYIFQCEDDKSLTSYLSHSFHNRLEVKGLLATKRDLYNMICCIL